MITKDQYLAAQKIVDDYVVQENDKLEFIKQDINKIFEDLKKTKPIISLDGNYPLSFWAEVEEDYDNNFYIELCGFDDEYYNGDYQQEIDNIRKKYPDVTFKVDYYVGQ